MNVTVNAIGDACPIPVVKTIKAINSMTEAGTVETSVDNETAVENLKKLASGKGFSAEVEKKGEKEFIVRIGVGNPVSVDEKESETICQLPADKGNTVVVFEGSVMGKGDEKLGTALMKSFIFALTQLPELPKTLLFYNGGAKLTVEDSPVLEDLKKMEEEGVEILTCGTCLNYYGLTEKLAVGSVTNMYVIVEKLAEAGRIVKP